MAIVFCKSCKAKITQRDTTCPSCGATSSKLVPLLVCIIFSAAGLFLYNAYRQTANSENTAIASENNVPAAKAAKTEIIRMGQSEE